MRTGVIFPQTEIGADPVAIRDYAQSAEELGYDYVLAFDHVLGANSRSRPEWRGSYEHTDMFHEPFDLFAYLAGVTETIGLVTGVLILPQRQTALVAKQAASLDVISSGRLRLGIGIGWNSVEYEALGENFHDRGLRSEEQIEVMRALWTQELVTYDGRWHGITDAGINPLPVQRPIPIWMGGNADAVIRRVATQSDGWMTPIKPDSEGKKRVEEMYALAIKAGRKPSTIGIEGRTDIKNATEEDCAAAIVAWLDLGATHLDVSTMGAGLKTPQQHIEAIRRFKEVDDALV